MSSDSRFVRRLWAAARLAAAGVLVFLAALPTATLLRFPSFCIYKALFGSECLSCGMTRALSAALHGRLATAVAYNPVVVVVLPAVVLFVCLPQPCFFLRHRQV